MRRLLKEAAELSRALDLIIATQGSDSPAVTPIIQQLSTLHRVLEDVYEESTGRGAIGPSESPNEGNSDIHRLEGRLDRTEEQFNDLKDSISRLVSVLGKKGGTVSRPDTKNSNTANGTPHISELKTRNVKLQRELEHTVMSR